MERLLQQLTVGDGTKDTALPGRWCWPENTTQQVLQRLARPRAMKRLIQQLTASSGTTDTATGLKRWYD